MHDLHKFILLLLSRCDRIDELVFFPHIVLPGYFFLVDVFKLVVLGYYSPLDTVYCHMYVKRMNWFWQELLRDLLTPFESIRGLV